MRYNQSFFGDFEVTDHELIQNLITSSKWRATAVQVRADKEREVRDGHDGTWVAHPALMTIAKEIFDRFMPTPNQVCCAVSPLLVSEGRLGRGGGSCGIR